MARTGVVESQGDFGAELIERISAAAPRYTKVGLDKGKADKLFELLKYAPTHEGEERIEPVFIPTPIPFALVTGTFSWGLGCIDRIPAFTYSSLLAAYKEDNPLLLESQYGYSLNKSKSDLYDLWTKGEGRLCLNMKVTRPNTDTIFIIGSGEVFKPDLSRFKDLQMDGQIAVEDLSKEFIQIKISRVSGARKVNMDDVHKQALEVAEQYKRYSIRMTMNNKAIRIGIKDWITVCIHNYVDCFNQSKSDRIAKLELDIKVFTNLPAIGKLVLAGKSNEEIKTELGIADEVLSIALKKSINQ